MSDLRSWWRHDLAVVSIAAVASLALIALPFGGVAKAIALVPLVIVLPGYAIAAAMFTPGAINRAERFVYVIGLSVGAATLGGLAWQFVLGLDRTAWAVLLTFVTLLGCALAQRRRGSPVAEEAVRKGLPKPPRLSAVNVVAALVAIGIVVTAVNLAVDGLESQRAEPQFSSLWVVPRGPVSGAVEVGVWNHMGSARRFRLSVERDGSQVRAWGLRLGPDERLQRVLTAAELRGRGPLLVTLYEGGEVYRRVKLEAGAGA